MAKFHPLNAFICQSPWSFPLVLSSKFLPLLTVGSVGNFIHSSLVAQHQMPLVLLQKPLSVSSINGDILPGPVQFCTVPIKSRVI